MLISGKLLKVTDRVRIVFSRLTQAVCYDVYIKLHERRVAAAMRAVHNAVNRSTVRKALM